MSSTSISPSTPKISGRRPLGAQLSRFNRNRRRDDLIKAALRKHGVAGIGAAFKSIEHDFGDIGVDRRLEYVIEADEGAIRLFELASAAR
jgi:hypothetical protein